MNQNDSNKAVPLNIMTATDVENKWSELEKTPKFIAYKKSRDNLLNSICDKLIEIMKERGTKRKDI